MNKKIRESFRQKFCRGCPRDCVTAIDVDECMLAYKDFIKDYNEEAKRGNI